MASTYSTEDGDFGWWCQTCDDEAEGYRTATAARDAGHDHDDECEG